jgi:hypothetical protein
MLLCFHIYLHTVLLQLILFHLYCIVVLQHLVLNGKVVHFEQVKYRHVCIIYLKEAETKNLLYKMGLITKFKEHPSPRSESNTQSYL